MSKQNNITPPHWKKSPAWSNAPEWANYLAMDEDGDWAWYERKPKTWEAKQVWDYTGNGGQAINAFGFVEPELNRHLWRESLQKRPDNE
jgi:hypothetical protein